MDPRQCPAAHSMDTTWFAVDADGKIARFESGEDGAVPLECAAGPEAGDFDEGLLRMFVIAAALRDGADVPSRRPLAPDSAHRAVIVIRGPVASEEGDRSYREAAARAREIEAELGEVIVLHEGPPRIVATQKELDAERLDALERDPRVERVVVEEDVWDWENAPLFRFGNDDYGNPGAYSREHRPEKPLRVGDVPADMREALSKLKLPVRFEETEALHLADHLRDDQCGTWGETTLRGEPLTVEQGWTRREAQRSAGPDDRRRKNALFVAVLLMIIGIALALVFGKR